MQDFIAALIAFFLIEPLQAEMEKRIGSASRENMAEVSACIRAATPVLVRQARTTRGGRPPTSLGSGAAQRRQRISSLRPRQAVGGRSS